MKYFILTLCLFVSSVVFAQKRITVERNPERSSGAYYVEQNIPSTLTPYLWLDASNPEYFSSDLNLNSNFACPNDNLSPVRVWKDRSGNNRHFTAYVNSGSVNNARPTYVCNTISTPFYKSNAHIRGDGINDDMRFDFSSDPSGIIDEDFTFVFVMRAEDNTPGTYNSFISSGTGANVNTHWQISTTNDLSNFYLLLRGNSTRLIGPYDTNPHVFTLQRKTISSQIHVIFKFDGVQVFDYISTNHGRPTLKNLKLFRNRNEGTYIEASFYEFFVFTQDLSANQEYELSQYLLSKWGI